MIWWKGTAIARLSLVALVCMLVVKTSAQQPGSSASQPASPQTANSLQQHLTETQQELNSQIVHTRSRVDAVIAGQFFAFHSEQTPKLISQLHQHIDGQILPPTVAEQREMTRELTRFLITLKDYIRTSQLHRLRIQREQKRLSSAMFDFPETEEAFKGLRQLSDQAELYKQLLIQHARTSQIEQDLKDLSILTKHRLVPAIEHVPPV